jgi:hypothetical protein
MPELQRGADTMKTKTRIQAGPNCPSCTAALMP